MPTGSRRTVHGSLVSVIIGVAVTVLVPATADLRRPRMDLDPGEEAVDDWEAWG